MQTFQEQLIFPCSTNAFRVSFSLKAAKYEIQKSLACRATLFRCKFSSMFPVFHLEWSTWPATKTFVTGWRNVARWLVDLLGHEQIRCATSCEFDEKQATKPKFVAQCRPGLYFSQQLSSTRNKCFCCATSWSRKVKNGKHRRQLATKQCCATSWGFLYLVFRRLYVQIWHQFSETSWMFGFFLNEKSIKFLLLLVRRSKSLLPLLTQVYLKRFYRRWDLLNTLAERNEQQMTSSNLSLLAPLFLIICIPYCWVPHFHTFYWKYRGSFQVPT